MNRFRHTILSICHGLLYPVQQHPIFFLFTFLIHEAILISANLTAGYLNGFLGTLLPLFDGYLFCVLATLLRPIRLHWLSYLLFTAVTLGEIFSMYCYHSQYTMQVLLLVMQTTGQESREFIAATLHTAAPWLTFAIVAACALLAWGMHRLYHRYATPRFHRIFLFIVLAMVLWSAIREVPQYVCVARSFRAQSTTHIGDDRHCPRMSACCVRFLYSVAFNLVSTRELSLLEHTVAATSVSACSHTVPTILLVIGESYSKHHTPLYDSTCTAAVSPRLSELRDQGQLLLHRDAVSCSNLTSVALRSMLSTPHSLFPAVFRKAGYKVYFWSNQFVVGASDFWSVMGGTVLNHPNLSSLQFSERNTTLYPYDGQLIDHLPSIDTLTASPSLIIVHLMGQHVEYAERFPDSRAYFQPEDMPAHYGHQHEQQIRADYANATRYNDSVVAALWLRLAHTDAVGIYLSDHGEEIYDWRNYYERTDMNQMNPSVATYQMQIPLMFFCSPTFQQLHPQLHQAMANCLTKPWINYRLYHTLFTLAGISYPDYQPQMDLLSPHYDCAAPRILGNGMNYDAIISSH